MIVPILIALCVAGIAWTLSVGWSSRLADTRKELFAKLDILRKDSYLPFNPTTILTITGTVFAVLVLLLTVLLRPPFLAEFILLTIAVIGTYGVSTAFLSMKVRQRQAAFMPQLEQILRMFASSLTAGLGLRQAIVLVTEDVAEPARTEFMRVVGRTNIGIGMNDAIDEMAGRMPSSEMAMTARAIRAASQTGGDLAKILDKVATTIQGRRTLLAKMSALTAEARIGALVILVLPFAIGTFISLSQPKMGHALLFTPIGQASLGLALFLEGAAGLTLRNLMRFDP